MRRTTGRVCARAMGHVCAPEHPDACARTIRARVRPNDAEPGIRQETTMAEVGTIDGIRIHDGDGPLRAAVLSIGSELMLGDISDTNATWLSRTLGDLGVEVVHHLAAGDDIEAIAEALRWLAARAEVIVIGGGLGPTSDDLTRQAVAAAAGVDLEHRADLEEAIAARFASMGRDMPSTNLRQAEAPVGARSFAPVGTAPGFALTLTDPSPTRVAALPGVPWELRALFLREVAPEIQALAGPRASLTRVVHVVGRGESDVAAEVEPIAEGRDGVTLSFLARDHEIQVRLTVFAEDAEQARAVSEPVLQEVIEALGPAVAGVDDETLEDTVLRLLGDRGETVATAESATAGDIAARLGRVPGASLGLVGGEIVYDARIKHERMGVPEQLLDEHGPVSAEVTEELARQARVRFGTDWGVAVTGSAGPQPQDDQPIGTAFWALAGPDGTCEVHGRILPGDREQVIARLGSAALDLLRRRLQGH